MKTTFLFLILSLFCFSALAQVPTMPIATPPAPAFSDSERHTELAARRARVAAKMSDNSVLVMFSAEPKLYTGDVDYVFRQENDLFYLTELKEQNISLVIEKKDGKVSETVFLPKRDPRFETWNGKRYSIEDAKRISGIANVVDSSGLDAYLNSLSSDSAAFQSVYLLLPEGENDMEGQREYRREAKFAAGLKKAKPANARPIFDDLRQIKSAYELKLLQHAIDISIEGHMRAWATVGRASWEYEVQAELEYVFKRRNADYWGYPSIVGCGPNATTLHYEESQSPVKAGQLMLIDAAAEYSHYSADITRTFPVNGKFSKEQAEIYQIVYDAQEAAAKTVKPGSTFAEASAAADRVIKDGLFKLGLITDANSPQYRLWYMHGLGHWIGMNVHDVGSYTKPLAPGMVFTIEPGIYIRADALDYLPNTPEAQAFKAKVMPAFEKYKNIGVRIEDDVLVTPDGIKWLSAPLPRKMDEIEKFMQAAPKKVPFGALSPSLFPYARRSAE
ncbi:MAG: aminopeptidase P [Acidobacteria bacterium OLB17]|nr:MAG: aminopeptidase P [Acidobacteria bacterium OLB17]MCZ2389682.1 aminopeptidase P family protein [Acidobacteriota bacterium]